ncbi:MAG: HD-GYP domain-containing protein [Candidatus Bipolaricaulis sp.]|nr:HD-GYP domain-containing protein [Candidatus Bipolaricaulis sp.]MDD5220558.1 HD-GYP domain-containing protein [Candidatus Bipolaricaulis sp.]
MAFYLRDCEFLSVQRTLAFVLFLVLGLLSEIYAVWIPAYGSEVSSSMAIYMASLFILGPSLTVAMVFVTTLASEVLMRWDRFRSNPSRVTYVLAFNIGQLVLSVAVTGILFFPSGNAAFPLVLGTDYLWAMLAFVCYATVNLALVTGVVSMTERQRFLHRFLAYVRDFSVQYLVLGVLALLLAVLYSQSIWHMLLAIVPLFLVHLSFRSYQRLRTEARKTFEKISRILDERDHYTAVHSSNVAELAVQIAQEMGLSETDTEQVEIAARVHDIGKVAVPDSILLKPGPLSDQEWEVMKRHPVVSAELIEGLEIYSSVAVAVRHEHERWDGSGYPDGLKGEKIPVVARVIAAADIYNALSTNRPYRPAFSREETLRMIEEMRGKDLDPAAADALLAVLRKADTPSESSAPA